jgi:hypothetical protein
MTIGPIAGNPVPDPAAEAGDLAAPGLAQDGDPLAAAEDVYSSAEEAEVAARLTALGYLD